MTMTAEEAAAIGRLREFYNGDPLTTGNPGGFGGKGGMDTNFVRSLRDVATAGAGVAAAADGVATATPQALAAATTATVKADEAVASANTATVKATSAATSAATATSKAGEAAASATSAATSAVTATSKAGEAAASATSAATSAMTATTMAGEAASSATNAAANALSANTKAGEAATSAAAAAVNALNASTKAAEAAASAASAAALVLVKQPNEIAGGDALVDFPFASPLSLPSGVVKGNSSKWVFGAGGLLTAVPAGTPPIEFDPVTGGCKGLLIEPGRTQLFTFSSDLSQSTLAGATTALDVVTAPDGSTTGDRMIENGSNSVHTASRTVTITANSTVTFSYFVKQSSGSRWVCLSVSGTQGSGGINFSPSTGTLGTSQVSGSYTVTGYDAKKLAGGWYRVHVTVTTVSDTTITVAVKLKASDGGASAETYAGDGASSVFLWGAQAEIGQYPTSPIPATSSIVVRNDDLNVFDISRTGVSLTEATVYAEVYPQFYTSGSILSLSNGTQTDTVRVIRLIDGQLVIRVYVGGTLQATLSPTPSLTTGGMKKIAFALRANDSAAVIGGGTAVTASFSAIPPLKILTLGGSSSEAYLGGCLSRITIFPFRVPNATLQQLVS